MLVATLEQERKNIYQAGQVEERRRTLLQFLDWRFQPTQEERVKLERQLVQVTNLEQLTKLTEQFLQTTTLAEFQIHLAKYLPATKNELVGP